MRRLDVNKPSGKAIAQALPQNVGGGRGYYNLTAHELIQYEEFEGSAIDTQDWTIGDSSLGTGAASAITFSSSVCLMDTSTGTGGTTLQRIRSAQTANAHLYSIPFRVIYWARISTTAGAGVAPSNAVTSVSCLWANFGIRDTGDTYIAQFNLDLSTAGGSSLACPVVNVETRRGSTGASFINSAAHTLFTTSTVGMARSATAFIGYAIEVTERGVTFGYLQDRRSMVAPFELSHFGGAPLALDKQYYLDARITADGTAGYTQTDGVQLEIDSIHVEQLAPVMAPARASFEQGAMLPKSLFSVQALASATLVTSGAGLFHGVGYSSTVTSGADIYYAVFDASAAGSSVYDFNANGLPSAGARLMWYTQLTNNGSAALDVPSSSPINPPAPLPFYRGLVIGAVTVAATAAGNTGINFCTIYSSAK